MMSLKRHQRLHGDRGAALVEFALVLPFLVAVSLGILEFGHAWHQSNGVERAVMQGARTAASQANSRMADFETLRAIDSATRGLPGIEVQAVIIYDATGRADGSLPGESCRTSSGPRCNFYDGDQVRTTIPSGFGGTDACAGGSWDSAWCPVGRDRHPGVNAMRIGVLVIAEYQSVTGMLPTVTTIERQAVYQIEPCLRGQESC